MYFVEKKFEKTYVLKNLQIPGQVGDAGALHDLSSLGFEVCEVTVARPPRPCPKYVLRRSCWASSEGLRDVN